MLNQAKLIAPEVFSKSGFMLGLGETREEVMELLRQLREAGCEIVTIGQYLRPGGKNIPVVEYVRPEVFEEIRSAASDMGFRFVASGPLVRSSMNAEEMFTRPLMHEVPHGGEKRNV